MKNKQLHEFVNALQTPMPATPLYQQNLKRALMAHNRKQSFSSRFSGSLNNLGEFAMKQKKLTGASLGLVLILALSAGAYTYKYSPKAFADQLVSQGLESLGEAPPDKIAELHANFGSDPSKELKEAKAAKDLKVITKAEYEQEAKDSPGVAFTTLDNGNGGPTVGSFSVKSSAKDAGDFTKQTQSVSISGGAVKSGTEQGATFSTGGTGPQLTEGPMTVGPGNSSGTEKGSISVQAVGNAKDGAPLPENMPGAKLPEPSKYLRYTNSNGQAVVLSLDEKGLPIFKTIFMKVS